MQLKVRRLLTKITLFNLIATVFFGFILFIQIFTLIQERRWNWEIFIAAVVLCSTILLIDYLLRKYVADRFDVFVWEAVILGAIWGFIALMGA